MLPSFDVHELRHRLLLMKQEHRELDQAIIRLADEAAVDQFQLQRMKKRKLLLKDQIALLESRLVPDLNA